MDVETEKVIELVFPDGIPDLWKDDPEFYQYLTKLGGLDIDQLLKEPDRLSEEKEIVLKSTQELAYSEYKTFIQTAESSREIVNQFNDSEEYLKNLLNEIPKFVDKCQLFSDKSKTINTQRCLNSLILKKNTELLEILEMPQLMETCLRNNQYNEALELSQYARQLGIKYNDIPIIQSIVSDIENSWSGMVGQVIGSLRGDLPLPKCLQLVGLLRSMDAFTEAELRIKFLQARDSWLQTLLNNIPKDDSNYHLTKTIELSRIHLFNIITQYRAMFNDDDDDHNLISNRDSIINESAIFYHWLEEKISQFINVLQYDLQFVTSIDSILGQCTYFALSFGRVGVDFTSRISDVFIDTINSKIQKNVHSSTKKFEKDMETFTLINKLNRSEIKPTTKIQADNPPEELLNFYPLAEYCNNLISIFNELRLCAAVALSESFTRLLEDSLVQVAKTIWMFYKQEQQAFTQNERDNMIKFVECFSDHLIPFIQFCIHTIFPTNQIVNYLNITVGQLQKEGLTYLNKKKILEPLVSLITVKSINQESLISSITPPIKTLSEHLSTPPTTSSQTSPTPSLPSNVITTSITSTVSTEVQTLENDNKNLENNEAELQSNINENLIQNIVEENIDSKTKQ